MSVTSEETVMILVNAAKRIPGARFLAEKLGIVSKRRPGGREFILDMLPTGSVGAEIGVHEGSFSTMLLERVAPKKIYLIDPWQYYESDEYSAADYGGRADGQALMDARYDKVLGIFSRQIEDGVIEVKRMTSVDALKVFPENFLDWVYIDGNHTYEFVIKDLLLCQRKVKIGGLITGDDYRIGGWWQSGVKKAVDQFKRQKNIKLLELRNGQFVLRKLA